MPLEINMETVDDNGYSLQTDIGQLGTVIYEVVTGERCEFNLFKDLPQEATEAMWPRRETLPCTKNIWLGPIIEQCWTKGAFQNANRLVEALDAITLEDKPTEKTNEIEGPEKATILPSNVHIESLLTFTLTVGTITFFVYWTWRRQH